MNHLKNVHNVNLDMNYLIYPIKRAIPLKILSIVKNYYANKDFLIMELGVNNVMLPAYIVKALALKIV